MRFFVLAALVLCLQAYTSLTEEETVNKLQEGEFSFVLDVRTLEEYLLHRLDTENAFHLDSMNRRHPTSDLERKLRRLSGCEDEHVGVHSWDNDPTLSQEIAVALEALGFTNVYDLGPISFLETYDDIPTASGEREDDQHCRPQCARHHRGGHGHGSDSSEEGGGRHHGGGHHGEGRGRHHGGGHHNNGGHDSSEEGGRHHHHGQHGHHDSSEESGRQHGHGHHGHGRGRHSRESSSSSEEGKNNSVVLVIVALLAACVLGAALMYCFMRRKTAPATHSQTVVEGLSVNSVQTEGTVLPEGSSPEGFITGPETMQPPPPYVHE